MRGKKKALARLASSFGITRLVESLPLPPRLLILNHHRIGVADDTPYDPGNYSGTRDELDWQVGYLKQHFDILTLHEALAVAEGSRSLTRPSVLITFDDGYEDNYLLAYPVLRSHGVPASFFLPTEFIGTQHLPWWDEIAYILKHSEAPRITLPHSLTTFDLTPANIRASIASVLELYKDPSNADHEEFLQQLEAACGCKRPVVAPERCFLDWNEAREMQANGMSFGSHTHSHPLLGKLPFDRQFEELRVSREILERELGGVIDTLAYPVGRRDSFSAETVAAARQAGYRAGFSFYSGINQPGRIDAFNILRTGLHSETRGSMRLLTTLQFLLPNSLT